jgi:AcrR family transcriptional regulator
MVKRDESKPTLEMKRSVAQRNGRLQYGAKRELILRAAGAVLQRNGINGTTVGAIAKEAGVDRATIYYYFADKGVILREAIHDGVMELITDLEAIASSGADPADRLRDSLRAVMRSYEKHYPQLYIFFMEGASSAIIDGPLYAEIMASGRRYEDLVEATARDGIREGVFQTSLPPKVFAKAVTGMLNWTSRWFVPGGALSADDVADGMARTVLSGVLVDGWR